MRRAGKQSLNRFRVTIRKPQVVEATLIEVTESVLERASTELGSKLLVAVEREDRPAITLTWRFREQKQNTSNMRTEAGGLPGFPDDHLPGERCAGRREWC
jgi:hypothetical protein